MRNHLHLFCYFSCSMKGKIYRVTYNVLKGIAELHMENGDVNEIPMTEDVWNEMIQGDIIQNFSEAWDSFVKTMDKTMGLYDPKTGEQILRVIDEE